MATKPHADVDIMKAGELAVKLLHSIYDFFGKQINHVLIQTTLYHNKLPCKAD